MGFYVDFVRDVHYVENDGNRGVVMKTVNVVVLFLLIIQLSYGQTKKYDFFPLVVGNTWTYEYQNVLMEYNIYSLSRHYVQTGVRTHTITSNRVSSDSTFWTVAVRDSALAIDLKLSYNDTLSRTEKISLFEDIFELNEIRIDRHLLISRNNSNPLWRFPQYWESVYGERTGPMLYRYSFDSSDVWMARGWNWEGGPEERYYKDSVCFRAKFGLIRLRYSIQGGTTRSPKYNTTEATLTDASITVPPQVDSIRQDSTTITIPMQFALHPAYPNPFSNTVSFTLDIPEPTEVSLKVLNTLGKEVAVVIDQSLQAGTHIRTWTPSQLSSGIYLCQLRAGPKIFENRILYLK